MTRKIGIMGGSFDPIHNGHLIIAERSREDYGLDQIIFMPTGRPPHKEKDKMSSSVDRYKMTDLAIRDNKHYLLSDLEIKKRDTSYTIDSLRELRKSYEKEEIYFILGGDSLVDFKTWKNYREILEDFKIIVARRPDSKDEVFDQSFKDLKESYPSSVFLLDSPMISISSSHIRSLKNKSKSIRYLLPDGVNRYIEENNLYGPVSLEVDLETIIEDLSRDLKKSRLEHSLRVMETNVKLAERYHIDLDKAKLAGILHDCGKYESMERILKEAEDFGIILDDRNEAYGPLIHADLGAYKAERDYGIEDQDILNAIKYHTRAREAMSDLEKITYLSDIIEPKRNFPGLEEIREMAFRDLNRAMVMALEKSILYLMERKLPIDPSTLKARNSILKEI